MKTILLATVLAAGQNGPVLETDIELALGTAGLASRTAKFDENLLRLFRQGEFTSPFYDACSESPWRVPFFAETMRRELATLSGRLNDVLNVGGRLAGFGTRRNLISNPNVAEELEAKKPGALDQALARMALAKQISGKLPSLAGVPPEVQQAAALLLNVLPRALDFRRTSLGQIGDMGAAFALLSASGSASEQGGRFEALRKIYRGVDVAYLGAGAHDLLLAAQTASTWVGTVPHSLEYDVAISTSWGWIRLTGGGATRHPARPGLLTIDTGGDDIYLGAPASSSLSNWASIVLDSSGNDRYLSDPALEKIEVRQFEGRKSANVRPGPGGALLGYCVLIDGSGDDLYRSHLPGLGSGRLGVAALLDRAGNDVYECYLDGIGFAMFGAGILEDQAGNDRYSGFSQVQGVGQTGGFGLLMDRDGKDVYEANDSEIDFPSPQSAQHNTSMAQGAANGRRGDYLDGHSLSGGVGILYDLAGDDAYSCGVFGQGVGYWKGVGMLWDASGTDNYHGQWYVQGASAHFAIGYLEDEAGSDRYNALMNMAQGAGHDFSLGLLFDRQGDDHYNAPNLSFGAGNANGIGWLLELAGNDTYQSSGITLGRAAEAAKGSLRSRALCLGVFMDLAGEDKYPPAATWAANGARTSNWTDRGPTPAESQVGVFWDR